MRGWTIRIESYSHEIHTRSTLEEVAKQQPSIVQAMAFFCPCLRWLQLTQAQENSSPNQSHDSLPVNPDNDKRHYQGVRATGDNDTEQIHFNLLRSKRENDDVLDDCKSPLLNLLITTKNAITNKIQQGKELASDSISIAYNNPEKADKNCYISEKSRAAECVICLIEFSESKEAVTHLMVLIPSRIINHIFRLPHLSRSFPLTSFSTFLDLFLPYFCFFSLLLSIWILFCLNPPYLFIYLHRSLALFFFDFLSPSMWPYFPFTLFLSLIHHVYFPLLCIYPFIYQCIHLYNDLSVYSSINSSIYLSTDLSIHPSKQLSMRLFIYLFNYPSIVRIKLDSILFSHFCLFVLAHPTPFVP